AEHPNDYDIITELQTQMEVFGGFAEMLGLPGFGEITEATLKALELNPEQDHYILQLALVDLIEARELVLEQGDRSSGGSPSAALLAFTVKEETTVENGSSSSWDDGNGFSFDSIFEETIIEDPSEASGWTEIDTLTAPHLGTNFNVSSSELSEDNAANTTEFPVLDDVFGEQLDFDTVENQVTETPIESSELEDIFASQQPPLEDVFAEEIKQDTPDLEDIFTLEGEDKGATEEQQKFGEVNPDHPDLEDVFSLDLESKESEETPAEIIENSQDSPELEDVFNLELEERETEEAQAEVIEMSQDHPELEDVFNLELEERETEEVQSEVIEKSQDSPDLEDVFNLELEEKETEETVTASSSSGLENIFGVSSNEVDENIFAVEGESNLSSENTDSSLEAVFGVDGSSELEEAEQESYLLTNSARFIDTEAKAVEDIFANINLENTENVFIVPEETQEINTSAVDESEAVTEEQVSQGNNSSRFKDSDVPTLEDVFEEVRSEEDEDLFTIPVENEKDKSVAKEQVSQDSANSGVTTLEDIFEVVGSEEDEELFTIPEENEETANLPINNSELVTKEQASQDNNLSRLADSSVPTLNNLFEVVGSEEDEDLFTIPEENKETANLPINNSESVTKEQVSEDDNSSSSLDPDVPTLEDLFEVAGSQEDEELFTIPEENEETANLPINNSKSVSKEQVSEDDNSSRLANSSVPTLNNLFEVIGSQDDDNLFTIPEITEEQKVSDDKVTQNNDPDTPSLDDVFGSITDTSPLLEEDQKEQTSIKDNQAETSPAIDHAIAEVETVFDSLPTIEEAQPSPQKVTKPKTVKPKPPTKPRSPSVSRPQSPSISKRNKKQKAAPTPSNLSIKVDFNRLERMNNLVGELMINRNSLSLQNDQMQGSVKALMNRFMSFQAMIGKLQDLSDQMLVAPEKLDSQRVNPNQLQDISHGLANFDSLEMDTYNNLYSLLGMLLEEMIQLEESVDDVVLFARTSNQSLEQQRQMLTNLRDELMWARMLPLGEVLNRFPRLLRDLSANYGKPVRLKLTGTGVLVDKAALEKLYDPLLHLVRNGFDHGIESPAERKKLGKPEEGQIEIRAYHQGNQTIVEVCDDGKGLNYDKIKEKAIAKKIITPEQAANASKEQIQNLIFEPAFSTAAKVSELSGRGVGLDVVRSQLEALKGTVTVTSKQGRGTIFTLKLPLTLTIAKLLVCQASYENSNSQVSVAFPSDTIEEILIPEENQIKVSGNKRFLLWQGQIIPIYPVKDLLQYNCPLPESFADKGFKVATPDEWGLPLLLLRRGDQLSGLEVSRLETEQELVIKPFGNALSAPTYSYGCTILGDGKLIPVVNGTALIEQYINPNHSTTLSSGNQAVATEQTDELSTGEFEPQIMTTQAPLMLVVDDSAALRRTLALTLEKAGYRVVQARDGREALEQLHHISGINMVICDVEMPNMNGFEFLGQRRRDPEMMKIPVAMLTSRSNDKHRQLATTLGANAYFTKPYIEQQFLTAIANILKEKGAVTVNT
ncbi:MAG: response regulator, partial [Microcystaceae cyanobacterium]